MKATFLSFIPTSQSELSRFTSKEQSEECAFSGQIDFSRNGRDKNTKILETKGFFTDFSVFFTRYTTLWSTSWCTNREKAYFCNVIPSRIAS